MDLYLRAAQRRDAEAMREIAALYQHGQHAPADAREAAAWLLLARQTNPAVAADADAALQSLPPDQRQPARDRVRHLLKRTL